MSRASDGRPAASQASESFVVQIAQYPEQLKCTREFPNVHSSFTANQGCTGECTNSLGGRVLAAFHVDRISQLQGLSSSIVGVVGLTRNLLPVRSVELGG